MLHNVSNRRTLSILVTLVATNTVLAQVKIKERVEIRPKAPVSMASVEETVLLADDPNPGGPIHVLVVHPCTITASAIIAMDHTGGYPSSDLYVKTLVGGSIAWYNGHNLSPPDSGSNPISFKVMCGSVPIRLESTWEGIDIRSTTKTITPSSATILINGMLSGHSYTVTVQLQATNDNSYDLATMDLSVDSSQLSQCQSTMGIHWKLLNNLGKPFSPISCTGTPPSYIQVQSESQVYIIDYWNRWTTRIDIPPGWEGAGFQWVYGGESRNSTATITLGAAGRTMSTTVTLVVDTNITGLQFDKVPWFVIHRLKSTLTLAGTVCGGNSLGPLPEGTPVNLEITQGSDLGYLRDPQTGTCGTELTSVKAKDGRVTVEYWARGREPNWCEYATIRASSSVGITESGIQVLQPNLKVTVEKPEVNFGDTAKISLQYQDYDGSLKQVTPAWTTFFQINYGSSFGRLCSPDFVAQGSYLLGQYPEVRVRTYNLESSPDSSLILIRIIASRPWDEGGGGGPAARVTPGDSLATWRKSTSKARPSIRSTPQAGTKIAQSEPDPDEMPNVGDGMYYFGSAQLVVKKVREECIVASFSKTPISAQDTTLLVFRNGQTGLPIAENEHLDLTIIGEQEENGFLLSADGELNLTLSNKLQPIWYVAPDSIEGKSLVVEIVAAIREQNLEKTTVKSSTNQIFIPTMTPDGTGGAKSTEAKNKSSWSKPPTSYSARAQSYSLSSPLMKALSNPMCVYEAGKVLAKPSLAIISRPLIIDKATSSVVKVSLQRGNSAIDLEEENPTITFVSGDAIAKEGEGFAQFSCKGTKGIALSSVPYSDVLEGSVEYCADGNEFLGRFPLRIQIGVSWDGENANGVEILTLKGPHTRGHYYVQDDPNWADSVYDESSENIETSGCALSTVAMVLEAYGYSFNPYTLNKRMNEELGCFQETKVNFDPTLEIITGSNLGATLKVGGGFIKDRVTGKCAPAGDPPPTRHLDENLLKGDPVFAEIWNAKHTRPHWVLITGKTKAGSYTILDPGKRGHVCLSDDEKIYGYRLVLDASHYNN